MKRLAVEIIVIVAAALWITTRTIASEDCGDACAHEESAAEHANKEHNEDHGHGDADEHHVEVSNTHDEHEIEHEAEDHEGHDHEAAGMRLTPEQYRRFGIAIKQAGPGTLGTDIAISGEVVFNGDSVVHMVPPVAGIVRAVYKSVGDHIHAGDMLATIDSPALADAKLAAIAAETEIGCCQFELPRAEVIHDNTIKLLALLKTEPTLDLLQASLSGEMGEYGSRLTATYAEYIQMRTIYERERVLRDKNISSEGDLLLAETGYKKAQATYFAERDSIAFEVRQTLLEVTRDQQLAELEARIARQRLSVLGLSSQEIAAVLAPDSTTKGPAPAATHVCTDPNCADCNHDEAPVAIMPTLSDRLGAYPLRAPIGGTIVERHLTLGERVAETTDIFTIANTESVWVELAVYTKHLGAVEKGQTVVLKSEHSGAEAQGKIIMVTPFVDRTTRSATARVVLDNRDGRWTPGSFVTGVVQTSETQHPIVIPRNAVQTIEGETVVFAEHDGAFETIPVTTGAHDHSAVEIKAGLHPGMRYVAEGAFELKATMVTQNLDPHAGHGH